MKSTRNRFNISLIGAGNVGTTLAAMLHRTGDKIVAVVSRSRRSAKKCGSIVGCRNCSDDLSIIPSTTDLILIAVPDQFIKTVAESLAARTDIDFRHIAVCHTSGALTSDELRSLGRKGAKVFSFHPAQTFPNQKSLSAQILSMKGIAYGIEGLKPSLHMAKALAKQLGGNALIVPKEAKVLYHCACVMASNYSVTLVGAIEALASQFSRNGTAPFRKLLETSVANAFDFGSRKALTGPVARGDAGIIAEHLKSIQDTELRRLYRSLGAYTLKLASPGNRFDRKTVQELKKLFRDNE